MLVLTRRASQQIIINNNIVITVVKLQGDRVRIGIEAPKEINVDRMEIYKLKKKNFIQPLSAMKLFEYHSEYRSKAALKNFIQQLPAKTLFEYHGEYRSKAELLKLTSAKAGDIAVVNIENGRWLFNVILIANDYTDRKNWRIFKILQRPPHHEGRGFRR